MKFRIAVHVEQAAEFEQAVIDMSTPGHPTYGHHMEKNEMKEYLRPSADVSEAVLSWLESEQVPSDNIENDGDWITFIVPVAKAESMLDTHFYYFQHKETQVTRIRTLQYSLPTSLHGHIDMIQPTTRFGTFRPQRATILDTAKDLAELFFESLTEDYDTTYCNTTTTPACLRGLYDLGNFTISPSSNNLLGISGYLNQLARYADLNLFKKHFATYLTSNFSVISINNGTTDQNDAVDGSVEANLDAQYAMALGANAPTTYCSTGGLGELIPDLDQPSVADNENEPYIEQLTYLLSLPTSKLPKVLTTSYGEDEQSVPEAYTTRACNMFAQLGSRGVSVIFSSGDTGVGSSCQTNDGTNKTTFNPIWPASCPFVTSVGGTTYVEPEVAVSFSAGGFSYRFDRPSYQDAAVSTYLEKLGDQWEGLYNPSGRGFPDVAAQAANFSVYDKGELVRVSGTSCSAPTFAGVISSLNALRLQDNKTSLGFLNPWIYSKGYMGLTDIVDGGSTGCTGIDIYSGLITPYVPYASWNATAGWDPVTGYGTPVFTKLALLMP